MYEGHIGTALKSWNDPTAKAALGMAKTLCGYAAQGDTYRALALLTKYERDKDGFAALLWTLAQLCSAVLRRPAGPDEGKPTGSNPLTDDCGNSALISQRSGPLTASPEGEAAQHAQGRNSAPCNNAKMTMTI